MTKRRKHNRPDPKLTNPGPKSSAKDSPLSHEPPIGTAFPAPELHPESRIEEAVRHASVTSQEVETAFFAPELLLEGKAVETPDHAPMNSQKTQEAIESVQEDIALLMQVTRNIQRRLISLEKPIMELSSKLDKRLAELPTPTIPSVPVQPPSMSDNAQDHELATLKARLKEATALLQRSQREVVIHKTRANTARDKVERIKNHLSYRVGYTIVNEVKSLRDAIALPYTLWKIREEWKANKSAGLEFAATEPASEKAAEPQLARESATANLALAQTTSSTVATLPSIPSTGKLKVAAICDEFTFHCFAPECDLLQLHSEHWAEQLKSFRPDLLFIESAWRGFAETWAGKVSTVSLELESLVDAARTANIPIAFWCKEDPVHFQRFLGVARLADAVFTTDIDCISRYQRELKHERVYLLPFAAQPLLHNPIQSIPRERGFSFAGSYYNKYKQRCLDFAALVKASKTYGEITIYDRNADRPQPHDFNYPAEYHPYIKGNLPYTKIDKAYKGYDFGITVNTIKHSQTMFARRAFELMASNTIVISNFSRGIRRFFSNSVLASDNETTLRKELANFFSTAHAIHQYRLQALRVVLKEHTYSHRLAYIRDKVGIPAKSLPGTTSILVFGVARNKEDVAALVTNFKRQTNQFARFAIVGGRNILGEIPESITPLTSHKELVAFAKPYEYIAAFSATDYYGPEYLNDLALGLIFSPEAPAFTKVAHFDGTTATSAQLVNDGEQYRPLDSINPRASLVRKDLLNKLWDSNKKALATSPVLCAGAIGMDEFGYCANLESNSSSAPLPKIDVPHSADYEAYSRDILRTAEALKPTDDGWSEQAFTYDVNKWAKDLPKKIPPEIKLTTSANTSVRIESALQEGMHKYIYLGTQLSVRDLPTAEEGSFLAAGKANGDIRLVLVFLDQDGNKISHLMQIVGRLGNLNIPAGTAKVRVGFRISGKTDASIGNIEFKAAERRAAAIIPRGEVLVVTYQYPSYDDLYKYGFVHSRVLSYKRRGLSTDVIRYKKLGEHTYREFEGVDVTESNISSIQAAYAARAYKHVFVHVLSEPELWDCIKQNLGQVRTTIWVHGSEIQPWWRRASNYKTDAERAKARISSNLRVAMWREVLTTKHPNLQIVFVSNSQAKMALNDLGLTRAEAGEIQVIGNYIDTEKFSYAPKPSNQRTRILSIRPYVSAVYANDLAVKAVLRLAERADFSKFEFRFVGDGPLFEETLAPLVGYSNVKIQKGFITQNQIAELHKSYGVFLVPTRMDSQGVSRDEAMASGLVPITNAVGAIPEFTDSDCAFAVAPEDPTALAEAILRLEQDPELFHRMSLAASQRVRRQSSIEQTIDREINLIRGHDARPSEPARTGFRLAVYGDVNMNIMDGSAVWAASLCEVTASVPGIDTTLFLKAPIERTQILQRLLLTGDKGVRIVEPIQLSKRGMSVDDAVSLVELHDSTESFDGIILRGRDLCRAAVQSTLRGKIWAYLTDIPQHRSLLTPEVRSELEDIFSGCQYILCQTPQMTNYLMMEFPNQSAKLRILPPMIPDVSDESDSQLEYQIGQTLQLAYAGKFAPRWGIREMFASVDYLTERGYKVKLQIFGDKIHNPPDEPSFQQEIQRRLTEGTGLTWHGSVDRSTLFAALKNVHVCWAYRDPVFEQATLELSTKALEYASLGIPTILARSPIFEDLFGGAYPLFASSEIEARDLLEQLINDPDLHRRTMRMLKNSIEPYKFSCVRNFLVEQQLFQNS